ncbi:YfiR family protein [Oxalobacteraceae bacterium]|nr:YfiR family protein [Oxalobacteraceae bacterium]
MNELPQRPSSPAPLLRRAVLVLAWVLAGPVPAQVPENDLKAAFVFNFAVFTQWPDEALPPGAPLQLCAYAGNPLQGALHNLSDKQVNGHRVQLRQPGAGATLRACHVLVLDAQDRERWAGLRRELAGASVLTVADDHVIGSDGAILALLSDHSRIAFDADMGAARGARLSISSKLLRLARSVQ